AVDLHAALAALAGDAAEHLREPGDGRGRLGRLLLELLGRDDELDDLRGRDLAVAERRVELLGRLDAELLKDLVQVVAAHDLAQSHPVLAQLALQQVASEGDGLLALLLLDEGADAGLGPGRLDEGQPVLGGKGVRAGEDLDRVAVLELVAQRHDLAVDLGPDASLADLGVNGVGEIDRRRTLGKVDDVAARREDEDLVGEEVHLHRLEELLRILEVLLPLHQLAQPGEFLLVILEVAGAALLVRPVRGDALLRHLVHLVGADLDLDAIADGADDRRVKRLVHVLLRHRDVVLEATRNGLPQGVDEAERLVAIRNRLGDDPEGDDVVDVFEIDALLTHLAPDRVKMLPAAGDLDLEAVFAHVPLDEAADLLDGPLLGLLLLGQLLSEFLVLRRAQVFEGEVLEFRLDPLDAE